MKISDRKEKAIREAINQAMRKAEHQVHLNFRAHGLLSNDIAREVFCVLDQAKKDATEWALDAIQIDGRTRK